MNVLVIDIGASHVKLLTSGASEPRRFDSHAEMQPDELVAAVKDMTRDWRFDVISIGYPGEAGPRRPTDEPGNLGTGWTGYDFAAAFRRPVRLVNDAAMQALGAYEKGRMLFLGLGTGLGSALVADRVLVPLELGCLTHEKGETLADRLGKAGLERLGREEWMHTLTDTAAVLRRAFGTDEIVFGGGNAPHVDPLPRHTRRGGNDDAFVGGYRLWEERIEPHDQPVSEAWRVLR